MKTTSRTGLGECGQSSAVARPTRSEGRGQKKCPKGPPFAYVYSKKFEKKLSQGGGSVGFFSPPPRFEGRPWPPAPPPPLNAPLILRGAAQRFPMALWDVPDISSRRSTAREEKILSLWNRMEIVCLCLYDKVRCSTVINSMSPVEDYMNFQSVSHEKWMKKWIRNWWNKQKRSTILSDIVIRRAKTRLSSDTHASSLAAATVHPAVPRLHLFIHTRTYSTYNTAHSKCKDEENTCKDEENTCKDEEKYDRSWRKKTCAVVFILHELRMHIQVLAVPMLHCEK